MFYDLMHFYDHVWPPKLISDYIQRIYSASIWSKAFGDSKQDHKYNNYISFSHYLINLFALVLFISLLLGGRVSVGSLTGRKTDLKALGILPGDNENG